MSKRMEMNNSSGESEARIKAEVRKQFLSSRD